MKIAIISDSHDNLVNLEKFLVWAKENSIEKIIHCGDIASEETAAFLANNFSGSINLVFGNMDNSYRDDIAVAMDDFKNIRIHGDEGELEIDGQKMAFCHFPDQAEKLAESGKYNLVFFGHTHKPDMKTLPNHCQIINPGTLAGLFNKATFAVYDTATKKLELKILELI